MELDNETNALGNRRDGAPVPTEPGISPGRWRSVFRRIVLPGALLASLGYVGYECYLARRQAQSVAAVRSLGGRVIYADELPQATLYWPLTWINSQLGHDYAAPVVAVQLGNTPLRDSDLACLRGFGRLQALWLQGTAISDQGLSHLHTCRHLQELSLRDTQIGDAGLQVVTHLPDLQFLYLHDTNVSDVSVPDIETLKNLKVLCIPDTKISPAGYRRLRAAMPQTRINH